MAIRYGVQYAWNWHCNSIVMAIRYGVQYASQIPLAQFFIINQTPPNDEMQAITQFMPSMIYFLVWQVASSCSKHLRDGQNTRYSTMSNEDVVSANLFIFEGTLFTFLMASGEQVQSI